jgi:hypothetical protein
MMGKKTGAAQRDGASEAICFRLVTGKGRWKHCCVRYLEVLVVGCGQAARDVSWRRMDGSRLYTVQRANNCDSESRLFLEHEF